MRKTPRQKDKDESNQKIGKNGGRRQFRKEPVEIVIQTAIAATIIGAITVTLISSLRGQSSILVWVTYGTVLLALLVPALYWQKRVSEGHQASELAKQNPIPPKLDHPALREKADELSVDFGSMGFTFPRKVLEQGPGVPMRIAGYVPVTLHLVGDSLFADADIYGGAGKPAIRIKRNEFEVTVDGWDKNSSANAFEVVNESHVPVFQMVYETPSRIAIKGYLFRPNGRLLFAGDGGLSFDIPPDTPLTPIFKYPSWKYPGEYAD